MFLKETEKQKHRPANIVRQMKAEGYTRFTVPAHTELWQARKAKDPKLQFGTDVEGYWYWYDSWVREVRKHCQENVAKYRTASETAQSA